MSPNAITGIMISKKLVFFFIIVSLLFNPVSNCFFPFCESRLIFSYDIEK